MSETIAANQTWVKQIPQPRSHVRLFCFPYAGGGSSGYYPWAREISSEIELCLVQLPGREDRWHETPFTRMEPLIEAMAQALEPYMDVPFAFYGHSLGALISFELARYLRRQQAPEPLRLLVSACHAPQLPMRDEPMSQLPEAEFIQALRRFNGTPESILQDPEMLKLLLPLLRADLALYETYTYVPEEPLNLPVSAYGGLNDFRATRDEVEAWKTQTKDAFIFRMYAGDHFFINTKRNVFLQGLGQDLNKNIPVSTPRR